MINLLARWIISTIALAIVAQIPFLEITYKSTVALMMATVVMGMFNSFIRPMVGLFTLPLNCLTFGLFGYVVNAVLFKATHLIVHDFDCSWTGAFFGPVLMGILSGILCSILPDKIAGKK
ncbi:MAG: phage holin family protein [Chthonomonadales bacterium]